MKNVLLIVLVLVFKLTNAQLLDSLSLDTVKAYTSLDLAKSEPDKVIKLVLKKQKLTAFPEEIRQFKNLQSLDLSKNKITKIPAWISELQNLQEVILSHNDIDSLTPQFCSLKHLKWFTLSSDKVLDALPEAIGGLTELRYMDMWGDNIGFFPSSLSKLTDLKILHLEDILINDEEQATIKGYLPQTTIHFSPACSCKN
jgi:Leucine-rich repeat (LRR) protein